MSPIINSVLAFSLLCVGIVAVTLIAILQGRKKQVNHPKFFKWGHRITGYIFIVLYLFLCAIMFQKFTMGSVFLSSKDTIHAYIGISIFPLIGIKVCIIYLFRRYHQSLVVYGVLILISVFITVTMSAGYYMVSLTGDQFITLTHNGKPLKVNLKIGRKVVHEKCVKCHSLERVYSHNKTEADWRYYVSRMRAKDPENMNELEEIQAIGYLVKNLGIDDSKMDIELGLKIILSKCGTCHPIERIFRSKKTADEWIETVEKMRSFDPFLLNSSEVRQVNYFLGTILAKQENEE
ncbi:MAG: hypothetical protein MRK02_17160 [Candidatus Scalindua sp.]|nr:hypothetical protein [Candidatus Scalindua sp.]